MHTELICMYAAQRIEEQEFIKRPLIFSGRYALSFCLDMKIKPFVSSTLHSFELIRSDSPFPVNCRRI